MKEMLTSSIPSLSNLLDSFWLLIIPYLDSKLGFRPTEVLYRIDFVEVLIGSLVRLGGTNKMSTVLIPGLSNPFKWTG